MFIRFQKDYTAELVAVTNAPRAADESGYPSSPEVKDTVFDEGSNTLKVWDGMRWVTVVTRPGIPALD